MYLHALKKTLHITGLLGIALLYCLATALCSGVAYAGNTPFSKQAGNSTEKYSNAVSAKLFQHTLQTENSITVCNHSNPVTVKNTFKDFSAINLATEHIYVRRFLQYNFFSHKLLARLQNTDLIFPFHYFW
jgi:hypothetical protein